MSQGSNSNETVTVSNDGITVEKTVTADEFPVPAVVFDIRCEGSTPAHVRLTDQIPESFPMERVGFHPEFESDRWTAYKDHRVEFERELDAGEEIKTVYGIRTDDTSDLSSFLSTPSVKELSAKEQQEAADIEGVLGPDNSQLVRDVLSGNRSSLPGVDGDESDPLGAEASDPLADATDGSLGSPDSNSEPAAAAADETDADETGDPDVATADDSEPELGIEDAEEPAAEEIDEPDVDVDDADEPAVGDDADDSEPGVGVGDDVDAADTETVAVNEGELSVDEPSDSESVEADDTANADDSVVPDAHGEHEGPSTTTVDAQESQPAADAEPAGVDDDEPAVADESAEPAVANDTEPAVADEPTEPADEPTEPADEPTESATDQPAAMNSQETAVDPTDGSEEIQPAITTESAVDGEVEDSSSVVAVQGGIAAVLASELRNDNVSKEDRALLEKELGSGVPRSVEVRLDRVQSQIEELSAYTDALEDFINDNGTATDIFGDLRTEVTELSSEIDEISVELDSAAGERADLNADLASVRTGINDIDRDVEQFGNRVETAEATVDDLSERVETAEDTVDEATDQVEKLDTNVSQLSRKATTATETAESAESEAEKALSTATSAESVAEEASEAVDELDTDLDHAFENIRDIGDSIDDLDEQVERIDDEFDDVDEELVDINEDLDSLDDTIRSTKRRLRSDLDELREDLASLDDLETKADVGELDSVADRVEEIEAEIDALQQFRNQLSSAFGGVGGSPDE